MNEFIYASFMVIRVDYSLYLLSSFYVPSRLPSLLSCCDEKYCRVELLLCEMFQRN